MRIMWLCGMMLPIVSQELGTERVNTGGWLDVLSRKIIASGNELVVCFPFDRQLKGNNGNLSYASFNKKKGYPLYKYDNNWELEFRLLLSEYKPDIIHIWGCEFTHSLAMVKAINDEYPYVVSLHGLPELIANHYLEGLPITAIFGFSLRDFLKRDNIFIQKKKYAIRGQYSRKVLTACNNVIGRTEYDYAYAKHINESVNYFSCNESLREVFYESPKWNFNDCEKETIFCSQAHYPIKGFHYLLQAVDILKKKYPDIKVYIAGQGIMNSSLLRRQMYSIYLNTLINKKGLKNNLIFLGNLSDVEMRNQYLKANVFVSSSLTENESNSVSEAKILGVPVVASFVGGVTERIENNVTGIFYQQNEPIMLAHYIEKVFSNKDFAIKLSIESIKQMENMLDCDSNYKKHMQIYTTIINQK